MSSEQHVAQAVDGFWNTAKSSVASAAGAVLFWTLRNINSNAKLKKHFDKKLDDFEKRLDGFDHTREEARKDQQARNEAFMKALADLNTGQAVHNMMLRQIASKHGIFEEADKDLPEHHGAHFGAAGNNAADPLTV